MKLRKRIALLDWQAVQSQAQAVIALDPDNPDASNYLAAAARAYAAVGGALNPGWTMAQPF